MKGDIKAGSFTKAKIDAILLVVFDDSIPKNAKKSKRLAKLNELHAKDPSKILDYLSGALAALPESVAAVPPDQLPMTTFARYLRIGCFRFDSRNRRPNEGQLQD